MILDQAQARVPLQRSMGCLVASVQVDLSEQVISRLADELLTELHLESARGVVFDLSGVSIMDSREFEALRRIEKMVFLMGARTIYAGFKPGVVSALIDLEADVKDIAASRNLDEAFELVAESVEESPIIEQEDEGEEAREYPLDVQ